MNCKHIAVVGGGLSGLSAAIRLAQKGMQVDLYESAPELGGRTRSFFHKPTQSWVDHGPHLLLGAYTNTIALLQEVDALKNIQWQKSLHLPLWEASRGHFCLKTSAQLPFSLALIHAVFTMPEHGFATLPSLLRMAWQMKKIPQGSVSAWMKEANIHPNLQRDMLELLCLGAMNEGMHTASAASFSNVLQQAFANHKTARLGWFTKPLSQALVEPLQAYCKKLGVTIYTSSRVLSLQHHQQSCTIHTRSNTSSYDKVILACSPLVRNKILAMQQSIATQPITNIHLWFDENITFDIPFIGGIGTYGQWFFNISQQYNTSSKYTHLCAVISADQSGIRQSEKINTILRELEYITGKAHLQPVHQRIITIQAATHLVGSISPPPMPSNIIDACEQPIEGELPATIETAIIRGEKAAHQCAAQIS
jgi:glycine/D-amino acid oxidase-like deaminating enzyme